MGKMKNLTYELAFRVCKRLTDDEQGCKLIFDKAESGEISTDQFLEDIDSLIEKYRRDKDGGPAEKMEADEDTEEDSQGGESYPEGDE